MFEQVRDSGIDIIKEVGKRESQTSDCIGQENLVVVFSKLRVRFWPVAKTWGGTSQDLRWQMKDPLNLCI